MPGATCVGSISPGVFRQPTQSADQAPPAVSADSVAGSSPLHSTSNGLPSRSRMAKSAVWDSKVNSIMMVSAAMNWDVSGSSGSKLHR